MRELRREVALRGLRFEGWLGLGLQRQGDIEVAV